MNALNRKFTTPFSSHLEFYREHYSSTLKSVRKVGHIEAATMICEQEAGDWSDAPSPDLVICHQLNSDCTARFDVGGGFYEGKFLPENFVLIPPHFATAIEVYDPHTIHVLALPYQKLQSMIEGVNFPNDGDFKQLHHGSQNDSVIHQMLLRLFQEAAEENPYGILCLDQLIIQIARRLLFLSGRQEESLFKGGMSFTRLKTIADLMHASIQDNLSLEQLARESDMSVWHFIRAFKYSTGMTPYEYFTWLRLSKAKMLLKDESLSIAEVAKNVGYSTTQAMAKLFNRHLGRSPREYRRQFNE